MEERSSARHRELQQENQGIHENLADLQSQLQQQEIRHNQELAIVLRGVNRNTRQIGVVTQRLEILNSQHTQLVLMNLGFPLLFILLPVTTIMFP
jgi:hypothetical protein